MTSELQQRIYFDVFDWYDSLQARAGREDDLAPAINERLAVSKEVIERKALLQILHLELMKQMRFEEASLVTEEESTLTPEDPMPIIALAEQKLYFEDNPAHALTYIERAQRIANASGNFRRHALNVKARILLKLGDFETLEKCLLDIVGTKLEPGQRDIGKERDFFDNIPSGSISEATGNRFKQYLEST